MSQARKKNSETLTIPCDSARSFSENAPVIGIENDRFVVKTDTKWFHNPLNGQRIFRNLTEI